MTSCTRVRGIARAVGVIVTVSAVASCGVSSATPSSGAADVWATPSAVRSVSPTPAATQVQESTARGAPGTMPGDGVGRSSATAGRGSGASATATPSADPYANVVPVRALVSPACVRPGDRITLTVTSAPGAFVGYQAVYADGQGGGAPPFGAGYGGNDKGRVGDDGRYVTSWVVSANAPRGRGQVQVVVADHGQFGETEVAFTVSADPLGGGCG